MYTEKTNILNQCMTNQLKIFTWIVLAKSGTKYKKTHKKQHNKAVWHSSRITENAGTSSCKMDLYL